MRVKLPTVGGDLAQWARNTARLIQAQRFFELPSGTVVLYKGTSAPKGWTVVEFDDFTPPEGCILIQFGEVQ